MDTGNNTAGKTAPERYVSEKAFEELPDTFQKLAELLGEDQFWCVIFIMFGFFVDALNWCLLFELNFLF